MRAFLVAGSLSALLLCASSLVIAAQEDPFSFETASRNFPSPAAPAQAPAPAIDPRDLAVVEYQRSQDKAYLMITFVFSGVAVAFLTFVLWLSTRRHPLSSRDVLRAVVVIFIAYGSIVLALAYPKNETMTGVIGILSAIAGYVFGRGGSDASEVRGKEAAVQ